MILLYLALTLALGATVSIALIIGAPYVTRSNKVARAYAWAALKIGRRVCISVQEDGELNWRKLHFDSVGAEKIKKKGKPIVASDAGRNIEPFYGRSFALLDEKHGVVFTPIHAAIGKAKRRMVSENDFTYPATKEEKNEHGVIGWIRAKVFVSTEELPDLRDVRQLATGSERGTDPELGDTFYEYMKTELNSLLPLLKVLVPIGAFVVTIMVLSTVGGSGGSSSAGAGGSGAGNQTGNGTTLNTLLLLFSVASIPKRYQYASAVIVSSILILAGLWAVSPVYSIYAFLFIVAFCTGMFLSVIGFLLFGFILGTIGFGGALSNLLFASCMEIMESPSIILDDHGYVIRDIELNAPKHKIGRYSIQFGFTETALRDFDGYLGHIDYYDNPDEDTKIAAKERGTVGLLEVSDEPDEDGHYIASAGALGNLAYAWNGEITDSKIQKAKEKYGQGLQGMGDKAVMLATFGAIVFAVLTHWLLL